MIVAVVEKSLKEVAEIKAQALAEAAEWKRKYEMEHLQCLHLENCALGLWIFLSKGWFVNRMSIFCLSEILA